MPNIDENRAKSSKLSEYYIYYDNFILKQENRTSIIVIASQFLQIHPEKEKEGSNESGAYAFGQTA
jgi:hypothetical protein